MHERDGQDEALEPAIRERGEALLASVQPRRLITLTPAWWQEHMLN